MTTTTHDGSGATLTTVERLIASLERAAKDPKVAPTLRAKAQRDADGYRKAWEAKKA